MINAGKTIVYNQFDQNRLTTNVEVGLGKTLSAELGYIRFHQQRKSGHEFFNRDTLRFTTNRAQQKSTKRELFCAFLKVVFYKFRYASRAATPGSTLPSIYSNNAPPPVET